MDHSYASRKQTENVPEEKEKLTEEQGPSLAALSSGTADPTPQQRGTPVDLPAAMRAKMENAFGADLSAVRLYESRAVAEAGADAFAQGSDIAFAPGLIDFSSYGGQALLGHEISHVVSQARGEVTGDGFLADSALEARADREGAMAAAGEQIAMPTAALSPVTVAGTTGPIQAAGKPKDVDEDEANPGRKTIGAPPAPPPPVAAAQTPAVAPPAPSAPVQGPADTGTIPSITLPGAKDAETIPSITLPGAKDPAPAAAPGPGGAGAAPAAAQGPAEWESPLRRSQPAFYRADLDIARGKLAEEDLDQYDALMDMLIHKHIHTQNDLPAKQRTAENGYQPPTDEMFQKAIGWDPKKDYARGSKEYEKQYRAFRNNRANWYNPEVKRYNDLASIVSEEQKRQARLPREGRSAPPMAPQQAPVQQAPVQQAPMQQPTSDYGALTPEQQMQMQMMIIQMDLQMQMMNGGMGTGMMQPNMGMGMGMPMMQQPLQQAAPGGTSQLVDPQTIADPDIAKSVQAVAGSQTTEGGGAETSAETAAQPGAEGGESVADIVKAIEASPTDAPSDEEEEEQQVSSVPDVELKHNKEKASGGAGKDKTEEGSSQPDIADIMDVLLKAGYGSITEDNVLSDVPEGEDPKEYTMQVYKKALAEQEAKKASGEAESDEDAKEEAEISAFFPIVEAASKEAGLDEDEDETFQSLVDTYLRGNEILFPSNAEKVRSAFMSIKDKLDEKEFHGDIREIVVLPEEQMSPPFAAPAGEGAAPAPAQDASMAPQPAAAMQQGSGDMGGMQQPMMGMGMMQPNMGTNMGMGMDMNMGMGMGMNMGMNMGMGMMPDMSMLMQQNMMMQNTIQQLTAQVQALTAQVQQLMDQKDKTK